MGQSCNFRYSRDETGGKKVVDLTTYGLRQGTINQTVRQMD